MLNRYRSLAGRRVVLDTYDQLLREWGVETEEEDVMTPYGSTHLVLAGDPSAPPLVLFHGVGDDSALMWLENAKELAAHFRLIAVDTMGGPGKSEPNDTYFKRFDPVDWIDAVMDAKGLDAACFAGVSNGALLTQLYTANRPLRVVRAMPIAGTVAARRRGSPIRRMMKVFLPEALFPTPKNARRLMDKMCGSPAALDAVIAAHPVVMEHWISLLKYFNNRTMFMHRVRSMPDDLIDRLRDKTRILIGSLDCFSDGTEAFDLLRQYRIEHRVVEGAGHTLNMEMPELVNSELIRFLLNERGKT